MVLAPTVRVDPPLDPSAGGTSGTFEVGVGLFHNDVRGETLGDRPIHSSGEDEAHL